METAPGEVNVAKGFNTKALYRLIFSAQNHLPINQRCRQKIQYIAKQEQYSQDQNECPTPLSVVVVACFQVTINVPHRCALYQLPAS
jgi:hypothetical protein